MPILQGQCIACQSDTSLREIDLFLCTKIISERAKNSGDNDSGGNNLSFAPAAAFEVMVNRRHFENTLSEQLVGCNL